MKMVKLGEIGETFIGLTFDPTVASTSIGVPLLRSNNIQNGKITLDDLIRVNMTVPEKMMLHKGDILICARNGSKRLVGKTALIEDEGYTFGTFMAVFRSEYNEYIYHWFNSQLFRDQLERVETSSINQITQDMIRNFEIPLPALSEQRQIVAQIEAQLAVAEKAKAAAEKQLAAAREMRGAYLREVFDGCKWKRVPLGKICTLVNGDAYKETDWHTTGVPIIRIQNLNDSSKPFNYYQGSTETKVRIKNGDLLLAWSGTPGTSFGAHIWNRGDAILNQHIFRVDMDSETVNAEWLREAINTELDTMISRAHGAVGLRHITKGEVQKLPIVLPPIDEQHQLSDEIRIRTKKADALCIALQKQLDAINALPAAIMREAFGGIG